MDQAVFAFRTEGVPVRWERYGFGHINETYRVETDSGSVYALQKINRHVFADVPALMENVAAVTEFASQRVRPPMRALKLVPTVSGGLWHRDAEGQYWRMYHFISNSVCLQRPESAAEFYESARAFGGFLELLRDLPADRLHVTIADFHNTPARYRQLRAVLAGDRLDRARLVGPELQFLLEREKDAGLLEMLKAEGKIPLRVTHNDTMLNNVLFDRDTRRAVCVVDLDTVMPGLSVYDFGDAIRFGANTAAEDEPDAAKAGLDLELYRAYARGFREACPSLTAAEVKYLRDGARLITLECGLRFLMDYLDGDRYFAVSRPGQNLDRCRTQLALAADMERKWDEMEKVL